MNIKKKKQKTKVVAFENEKDLIDENCDDDCCKCFIREESTGKLISIKSGVEKKIGRNDITHNGLIDKGVSRDHLSLKFHSHNGFFELEMIGHGKQPVRILKSKDYPKLDYLDNNNNSNKDDACNNDEKYDDSFSLRNEKPVHIKNGTQFYIGLRNHLFTTVIENEKKKSTGLKWIVLPSILFLLLLGFIIIYPFLNHPKFTNNYYDLINQWDSNWYGDDIFKNQLKFKISTQISQNFYSHVVPRPVSIHISLQKESIPTLDRIIKDLYTTINNSTGDSNYKYLLEFNLDNEILSVKSKVTEISNQVIKATINSNNNQNHPVMIFKYFKENENKNYLSFLDNLLDGTFPTLKNSIIIIQTKIGQNEIKLLRDNLKSKSKEDIQYLEIECFEAITTASKSYFDHRLVHRIRDAISF